MIVALARRALACVGVLALAGCASDGMAPVVDRSAPAGGLDYDSRARAVAGGSFEAGALEHRVAPGDTLYGIAFRHGLDYRSVAAINGISEPYTIYPGQVLRLRDRRVAREPEPTGASLAAEGSSAPASWAAASSVAPVARDGDTEVYAVSDGSAAVAAGQLIVEPVEPVAPVAVSQTRPADNAGAGTGSAWAARAPAGPVSTSIATAEEADGQRRRVASAGGRAGAAQAASVGAPAAAAAGVAAATPLAAAASPGASTATTIVPGPSRRVAGIDWRWPTSGNLINRHIAGDPARQGIDIAGTEGQPVLAAAAGEVVYSGNGLIGYGELIIIKHSNELLSAYGHNRKRLIAEGQRVAAGQVIAEMGRSGGQLSQLHFEIRREGRPVDPLDYLPPR